MVTVKLLSVFQDLKSSFDYACMLYLYICLKERPLRAQFIFNLFSDTI
jgi:hypothetical protein